MPAPRLRLFQMFMSLPLLACAAGASAIDETSAGSRAAERIEAAIAGGVQFLIERQEGDQSAEWPYEGVYRAGGEIPIGYRVGGTAIAAAALLYAPQQQADLRKVEAIERAVDFIIHAADHPLMAHEFDATYDVRGWGYAYGLWFLLIAKEAGSDADGMDDAIQFFIDGIIATEIPQRGGWNYARRAGFKQPGAPSPFMTAATLQAIFAARAAGFEVPDELIERGIASLKRAKQPSGGYVYSGFAHERSRDGVPGAVGRMLVAESTLYLCGEATQADVRGAVDAFLVHWEWLEKRRAQHGTHAMPYGVAPYYFFFAHLYAAQAVELLPEQERAEYRRRVNERLFAVQSEDGTWNDRIFPRSAAYGTAMSMLALMMPNLPPPPTWSKEDKDQEDESDDPQGE